MVRKLRRDLGAGDRVGPYVVDARLGEGGMAEVFAGHHAQTGQRVALKRSFLDPETLHIRLPMFQREARIACKLLHPNIVTTYELITDADGNPILVMELLDGLTLKELGPLLRQTIGGLRLAMEVVAAAARALDYLHEQRDPDSGTKQGNLIHRDVAPDNLFVTVHGSVKLLDFGLAKDQEDARLTRVGILKGKAAFMSPEQAHGVPLDRRTDQYALGVTTYWLLTGVCPYERENVPKTLAAVLRDELKPASQINLQLPRKADAVLARAVSRDRSERYSSCSAFAAALDDALRKVEAPVGNVTLATLVQEASQDQGATVVTNALRIDLSDEDSADGKTDPRKPRAKESDDRTMVEGAVGTFSTNEEERDAPKLPAPRTGRRVTAMRTVPARRETAALSPPPPVGPLDLAPFEGPADVDPLAPLFTLPLEVPSALHPAPPPRSSRGAWIAGVLGALVVATAGTIALLAADALGPSRADAGVVVRGDAGSPASEADGPRGEGRAAGPGATAQAAAQDERAPADDAPEARPEGPSASAVAAAGDATPAPGADQAPADASARKDAAPPRTARRLTLRAGPGIEWRLGDKVLAQGDATVEIPADQTTLVAYDSELDVAALVPLRADARLLDYRDLPRTEVQILVRPWADVDLGHRALGLTPLKPLQLVAGRYRLTLKHKDQVQTHLIDVGGERQDFRYRF